MWLDNTYDYRWYQRLRATTTPPIIHARSNTLIASNGSRYCPAPVPIMVSPMSFIEGFSMAGSCVAIMAQRLKSTAPAEGQDGGYRAEHAAARCQSAAVVAGV